MHGAHEAPWGPLSPFGTKFDSPVCRPFKIVHQKTVVFIICFVIVGLFWSLKKFRSGGRDPLERFVAKFCVEPRR